MSASTKYQLFAICNTLSGKNILIFKCEDHQLKYFRPGSNTKSYCAIGYYSHGSAPNNQMTQHKYNDIHCKYYETLELIKDTTVPKQATRTFDVGKYYDAEYLSILDEIN